MRVERGIEGTNGKGAFFKNRQVMKTEREREQQNYNSIIENVRILGKYLPI